VRATAALGNYAAHEEVSEDGEFRSIGQSSLGCARDVRESEPERVTEFQEIGQARVPFASFDSGYIRSVEAGIAGKLFLGESPLGTEGS
jgi:hypothetical protein